MNTRLFYVAAAAVILAGAPAIVSAQGLLGSLVKGVVGGAPPPPQAGQTRTGGTSASGAAGASYSTGSTGGAANLDFIAMMPKNIAPIPVPIKVNGNTKYFHGKARVGITGYTLGIVRTDGASAYAGGAGSEQAGRRLSIGTALVGVDDQLPKVLADEAYKDLAKRLTDAGFEVIPNDQVQASSIGKLDSKGSQTVGANKVTLYAPDYAPIRTGTLLLGGLGMPGAAGPTGDAAKELDAVLINPFMTIDYANVGGSGNHVYSGSASINADVRFHLLGGSGALVTVTPPPPYRGGWGAAYLMPNNFGSAEPFAIMYEIDDKSDSKGVHNALALAGLGDIYRQSKYYAVEADPGRYAALVRAAYRGMNAAIVAEMVKSRG